MNSIKTIIGRIATAAIMLVAIILTSASAAAYMYSLDTNSFGIYAPDGSVTGVSPLTYHTVYQSDRYGQRYQTDALYADGTTHSYGYRLAYGDGRWYCAGNACGKTPYLNSVYQRYYGPGRGFYFIRDDLPVYPAPY